MRLGTGGIFAIAVSGATIVSLIFTFSVSGFLRETSGDGTRWQGQTSENRSDLIDKSQAINLPSNINSLPSLPPGGDEDHDGVPNGEDPDPTNPNSPNLSPQEFHIDNVEKFVVDPKENKLTKNIKIPQYHTGLFALHLEFTNDQKSRIIRLQDYPAHDSAMMVQIAESPKPVVCLSGQEVARFDDDFCIGEEANQPTGIDIVNKKPPIWDIAVSKPGKYKLIFYVVGEVKDAGKQLNTAEAFDRLELDKKNRREKDSASITGINQLDIKLAKYVRLPNGEWGDVAKSNFGDTQQFKIVLTLDNLGGDHRVSLRDRLSGLIFKDGSVQINDQEIIPVSLRDLARWSYEIPRERLGKQNLTFLFSATVASFGIGTNTATVVEVGKITNRASERVFVVTLFEFGPRPAACDFCKLGRVKDGGEGFTNLLFAKPKDQLEFQISIKVEKSSPINLKDLLPQEGELTYLADTLKVTENGKKRDLLIDESFFTKGILLEPTSNTSWFNVEFVGLVTPREEFTFKNIAVSHKPNTDPNDDKVTEMIILSE